MDWNARYESLQSLCAAAESGIPLLMDTVLLVVVIVLGIVLLLAALHNPSGGGRFVYAFMLGLVALTGAGIAGWHARLQRLPADEVPACGPGLDYMLDTFPIGETLKMVFTGSGECADIVWEFIGISMPGWVLIWMIGLGGAAIWNNLRLKDGF